MENGRIIRILILVAVIVFSVIIFAGGFIPAQQEDKSENNELSSVTGEIQKQLDIIAVKVENTSNELSGEIEGKEALEIMNEALKSTPDAVCLFTLTPDRSLSETTDSLYDTESTEAFTEILNMTKTSLERPVMTAVVECKGNYLFAIARPVYNEDKNVIGSLTAMIDAYKLLSGKVSAVEKTSNNTYTVMQTNGLILYDQDPQQVGANLFTDDIFSNFPNLRNLGVKFTAESEGYGSYMYYPTGENSDSKPVKKLAYWDSVGLYGTEWRVIMFKEVLS